METHTFNLQAPLLTWKHDFKLRFTGMFPSRMLRFQGNNCVWVNIDVSELMVVFPNQYPRFQVHFHVSKLIIAETDDLNFICRLAPMMIENWKIVENIWFFVDHLRQVLFFENSSGVTNPIFINTYYRSQGQYSAKYYVNIHLFVRLCPSNVR